MMKLMEFFMIIFILLMVFFVVCYLLKNLYVEGALFQDKSEVFECGFDTFVGAYVPYSVQFFSITILFLLFDVEMVLILPMLNDLDFFFFLSVFLVWFFLVILMLGLIYEWRVGVLDWTE